MTDWKPIESAPKDGNEILALWHSDEPFDPTQWIVDKVYWDGVWYVSCANGSCQCSRFQLYTHWMPLPAPPSCKED